MRRKTYVASHEVNKFYSKLIKHPHPSLKRSLWYRIKVVPRMHWHIKSLKAKLIADKKNTFSKTVEQTLRKMVSTSSEG